MIKLPLKNCNTQYLPLFLTKSVAENYLTVLHSTIVLEKKEHEGRLTGLYGDAKEYRYAFNTGIPLFWTNELLEIKEKIEKLTGYVYNVCLINYYGTGKDKFNFHSDKEEIGNSTPIAVLSLGAERKFYFRSQTESNDKLSIILENGSLILIDSVTHENYLHSLPPDNNIKIPRMSLTFRYTK